MPENKDLGGEIKIRKLDCAVIELLHATNDTLKKERYDTVRGMFEEGNPLYPGAGIKEKNHIQICVRNINCIKGYFKPLEESKEYKMP